MSVENIIDRIIIETEKSKRNIIDESGFKCRQILAAAEKQAKKTKTELILKSKKESEEEQNRRIILTALEIKKSILEEKRKIISDVYERVLKRITGLPASDMKKFLKNIIQNQSVNAAEIIVPAKYKDVFPDSSRKRSPVKVDENEKNFVIKTNESETRFSFESMVDALKENTEIKVAEILF
ncbi:MAG: hypothetical protein JW983_06545 [Elusimicrobia bacterium]|nr:hypothetical protein [Elusimicrobiota bacterium]